LSLPNVHYLIIYFKHRSSSGYIDSIFEWSRKVIMTTSRKVVFQTKF
jgi:hypothetical protein